jgi:hypothetical protein
MKTRWWMAVILAAVLAAMSFAQTTNVYSRNAVGVIRVDVPTNQWRLVSYPLDSMGPSNRVVDVIGTNVPDGTVVLFFTGSSYVGETYYAGFGWWPGTNVITRGRGFWLRAPNGFALYLTGEVPAVTNTQVQLPSGYSLVSFPYPLGVGITNTLLNSIAQDGDLILRWTGSGYSGAAYYAGFGWWPSDFTLQVGEGYWYRSAATKTWNEPKNNHYTYP